MFPIVFLSLPFPPLSYTFSILFGFYSLCALDKDVRRIYVIIETLYKMKSLMFRFLEISN